MFRLLLNVKSAITDHWRRNVMCEAGRFVKRHVSGNGVREHVMKGVMDAMGE